MTIGMFGVGVGSLRVLNAVGDSTDVIKRLPVIPPYHMETDAAVPQEQRIDSVGRHQGEAAAVNMLKAFEDDMSGAVVIVDFLGTTPQRNFQRECTTAFTKAFRDKFPEKMLHVVPILPDPRNGEYSEDIIEATAALQSNADGVVLYDSGLWSDEVDRNGEVAHQSLATRLRELYGYGARDSDSLRDISWVAADGGMALGYEEEELTAERRLIRKYPALNGDVSAILRRASYGQLTAPLELSNVNRGLVVIRTHPTAVDVSEVQDAVDTFMAETSVDTFRVGIQEDMGCNSFHATVALSGGGVGYEAAAIAKRVRDVAETTPEQ